MVASAGCLQSVLVCNIHPENGGNHASAALRNHRLLGGSMLLGQNYLHPADFPPAIHIGVESQFQVPPWIMENGSAAKLVGCRVSPRRVAVVGLSETSYQSFRTP